VAQDPSLDIELQPIGDDPFPLSELLTLFPLVAVVLDPYTHESSWLLDTARRILNEFRDADVRVAYLVTDTDADGAAGFLGPLAGEILGLADPDRSLVRSLGLDTLPALVAIRQDGHLLGSAEGWDPVAWHGVVDELVAMTAWSRPEIPAAGDPAPYAGTSALG
jgi:hypothetical protein|tara:strand:+ start:309 stop:800 length:492 start_codon:yes stop_codon:yes gene_type:complete